MYALILLRSQTFGEDPYLASEMGSAIIRGAGRKHGERDEGFRSANLSIHPDRLPDAQACKATQPTLLTRLSWPHA